MMQSSIVIEKKTDCLKIARVLLCFLSVGDVRVIHCKDWALVSGHTIIHQ